MVSPRATGIRPARHAERIRSCRPLSIEPLEARQLLTLAGNLLFPADNPWNQRIDDAPVAGNSATLVASIGANSPLHPDFGTIYQGAYIGIPFNVVTAGQATVDVVIDAYADESDLVPVPIPAGAIIEGDPLPSSQNRGDRHLIVYDSDAEIVYELYNVHRPNETSDGRWHADAEAVWRTDQNWFRNPGDTSADAAGLPILPGLVRPDEVLDQGVINHALRFTVPRSANSYVYPASHQAGSSNVNYPRMGERFRLKQDFDISGFSPTNRVILQALKDYGMIVADNGTGWYLSGQPSTRWNDDELSDLGQLIGNNFEAVNLTPLVTSLDQISGSSAGGTAVTIRGNNFSGAAGRLEVRFGDTLATNVTIISDNVLVATSPAHAAGTVHVNVKTPYGTSATTSGDQFSFQSTTTTASVVGRHVFYNQSKFDGNNAAAGSSDDSAIATDKLPYLAGAGTATFANITSYTRGINGIMIDLAGTHAPLSLADFQFKVGASNTPSAWATAPAPQSLVVRAGAGPNGSDRIEILWGANAPKNTWLQVTVKGNDAAGGNNPNTGLAASDVFYFGNRIGDAGSGTSVSAITNLADEVATRNNAGAGSLVTNLYDFDRNGQVQLADGIAARSNAGSLTKINLSNSPAAPLVEPLSNAPAISAAAVRFATTLAQIRAVDAVLAGELILPVAAAAPTMASGRTNIGFVPQTAGNEPVFAHRFPRMSKLDLSGRQISGNLRADSGVELLHG